MRQGAGRRRDDIADERYRGAGGAAGTPVTLVSNVVTTATGALSQVTNGATGGAVGGTPGGDGNAVTGLVTGVTDTVGGVLGGLKPKSGD